MKLEQLRKVLKSNPCLYEALKEYFQARLRNSLTKMVSCEDSNRLHFLRGVAFGSLQTLNDLFEIKEESSTQLKV